MRRAARRHLAAVAFLGIVAGPAMVSSPATAAAVSYTISPVSGPSGTVVTFTGDGCPAGDHVGAAGSVDGQVHVWKNVGAAAGPFLVSASFLSSASGHFTTTLTIPDGSAVGDHATEVVCSAGEVVGTSFTVTDPVVTSTTVVAPTTTTAAVRTTPTSKAIAQLPVSGATVRALAVTGNSRISGHVALGALSITLGMILMFITPRRRFSRIVQWFDERVG